MNQEKINSVLKGAVNDADLTASEIPSIDLYLDQIIKLISDKTEEGSPVFADRVPTKTMVNNYSKAELISPLKGKTYNKEQIIQILLTNSLKNTLSIAEIKSIMDCIYTKNEDATTDLFALYDKYLEAKAINRDLALEDAKTIMDKGNLDVENPLDALLICLALSSLADYFKCMSKSLLSEVITEHLPKSDEPDEIIEESKKAQKKAKKAAEKAAKKALEVQNAEDSNMDAENLHNTSEQAED